MYYYIILLYIYDIYDMMMYSWLTTINTPFIWQFQSESFLITS